MSEASDNEREALKAPFSTFYNTELMPHLLELEEERKEIKNTLIFPAVGIGILVVILIFILPNLGIQSLILAGITATGLWVWFKTKASKDYTAKFKTQIIGNILKYINPKFTYSPYGRLDRNEFVSTGIFNRQPDRYQGQDLISGKDDQTVFSFSEVNAQYYTKDHKGRRTLNTLFKGLMFKADFHKDFKNRTVILPDAGEKYFGSVGRALQKLNFSRPDVVTMENVDFEKEFVVYSSDPQEARYLLSPSFMEKLLACKNRLNTDISLSFHRSSIYIAMPISKEFFEPSIFSTIIDANKTELYFKDMEMVLEIIDELNLNTRIWSKMPTFEEPKIKNTNRII
ncbi:MAG: hypothetical protein ACI8XB_001945 [Patiriisocius sp.]|jgi:hypothetical protein